MAENHFSLLVIFFVFGLGIRHGLDLDHLAIIDAIARANNKLSKRVGILFSFGHGLIVILVSLILNLGLIQNNLPHWLIPVGNGISVFFLLFFGSYTLFNLFFSNKPNSKNSVLSSFYKKYLVVDHSIWIILIGALFAFSFDTMTQVALFSVSMTTSMNCFFAVVLGFTFMLGMMSSDGLNGLLISKLINRFTNLSDWAMRLLSLSIALFSLTIGLYNLYNLHHFH